MLHQHWICFTIFSVKPCDFGSSWDSRHTISAAVWYSETRQTCCHTYQLLTWNNKATKIQPKRKQLGVHKEARRKMRFFTSNSSRTLSNHNYVSNYNCSLLKVAFKCRMRLPFAKNWHNRLQFMVLSGNSAELAWLGLFVRNNKSRALRKTTFVANSLKNRTNDSRIFALAMDQTMANNPSARDGVKMRLLFGFYSRSYI